MDSVNISSTGETPQFQPLHQSECQVSQEPANVKVSSLSKSEAASGTSNLRKHLAKSSKNPYNQESKKQKTLHFQSVTISGEQKTDNLSLWKFDQVTCRDALAKMVITDELPFKFVEREGFREFCRIMQPNFKLISRFTVARDILAMYSTEKKKLKDLFKKSNLRFCLTTDSWTSLQNVSYMCLTAHFIDSDWKLHKRILNFCVISSHKGEAIGRAVETCLIEWGIDKLCTLTVDNASANDVAVGYLKRRFSKKSDTFILGGQYFHLRCFAHIINLIVKDGLSEVKGAVTRIRDVVKYVRSSPQREQTFKSCVEKERINFKKSLCLDVATRWSSTYLMLDVATKYQKVFERLEDDDPHFKLELNDKPTAQDWDDALIFTKFLEKFYTSIVHISGCLHLTSNLFFTEVCAIEIFLSEWSKSSDSCLSAMATKMKGKFQKYWGSVDKMNMLLLLAVVLDPRFKLRYLRFCYSEMYEDDMVMVLSKKVTDTLISIYDEYVNFVSIRTVSYQTVDEEIDQESIQFGKSEQVLSLQSKFLKYLEKEENDGGKSEIDKYLDDACEKESKNFDLLTWWKVNSSRYKVLSQIARDILVIPVSSVASESAFSTGGRVLDQFRSSLSPKLVECLICTQDWFRDSSLPLEMEENLGDIEELERALTEVNLDQM